MEKKFKIIIPILALAFSLVCANAIMPVPKLDLEEYEITSADKSKVYVEGTVSIAKGQQITVRMENSYSSIPITATKLGSSGGKENFQLKIPAIYISQGTNKFYVRSEGLRKVIHPSNMREVIVKISDSNEKKSQTISANNKSVQVGKTVSLGAKASSGLPLTYSSSNTSIATVSNKGVVTGKKAGACKITVTQNGNNEYKSVKKVVIISVIKSVIVNPANTSGSYTIVYKGGSNIGISDITGKMTSQKVKIGKIVTLKKCTYKKKGYEFVGWTTKDGIASKNGSTTIEKFKNINMKHFQLGKVKTVRKPSAVGNGKKWSQLKSNQKQKLKNKAKVKNLAGPGEKIVLYAVWKGKGPEAAVDWALIIAKDDNFTYGGGDRAHKHGCYFCGTNRSGGKNAKKWNLKKNRLSAQSTSQKFDKTYCCNPFGSAAYTHGANHQNKCIRGNMDYNSWSRYNNKHGKFKKVSKNNMKVGDIIVKTTYGHVAIYIGKGKVVEAASDGTHKYTAYNWSSKSIKSGGSQAYNKRVKVMRYYPK